MSKSTVLDVVHREGAALMEAIHRRADTALRDGTDTDADAEPVVVQLDEVKTRAQPRTGRKDSWAFTAVVMLAGWSHLLVDSTQAKLSRQPAALLRRAGVAAGRRTLLVVADGAGWFCAWFETLAVPGKAMVLCWYHQRKRCYQGISGSGLPRAVKKPLLGRVLGALWEGRVEAALQALRQARDAATRHGWIDELINDLEARRPSLPNYKARKEAGLVNASHRMKEFNNWAVSRWCKGRGMSWTAEGVVALAGLEAARRNCELECWRRTAGYPS